MKIKTSELERVALGWAVNVCENPELALGVLNYAGERVAHAAGVDWSQAGPIIEREKIAIVYRAGGYWLAYTPESKPSADGTGPIPLTAAMRCYVASKLGEEVDVPDELITINDGE